MPPLQFVLGLGYLVNWLPRKGPGRDLTNLTVRTRKQRPSGQDDKRAPTRGPLRLFGGLQVAVGSIQVRSVLEESPPPLTPDLHQQERIVPGQFRQGVIQR